MRIHFGLGYRVYYMRIGTTIYLLLSGGDKSSHKRDIAQAKKMARDLKTTKPWRRPTPPLMLPITSITAKSSLNIIRGHRRLEPPCVSLPRSAIWPRRGMAQIAEDAGLGQESLHTSLRAGGHPRYDIVTAVLRALGEKFAIVANNARPRS